MKDHAEQEGQELTVVQKIEAYLERANKYAMTPWNKRDASEYEDLMKTKAEIISELRKMGIK